MPELNTITIPSISKRIKPIAILAVGQTTCSICNNDLPELAIKHLDPFCSNFCAREHYGTQLDYLMPNRSNKKTFKPKQYQKHRYR